MREKPVDSFVEGSLPIVFSRVSRFVLQLWVCRFFQVRWARWAAM
ncbi:hypothetical protein NBRC3299_0552 [Acetobacter pasteurianus NBRC 3299]|uniref:Uncharacterized protein n=1 Tax=Acetobacter ascendens TaxID=481146 RepID=A0A1Y0V209_9PROT|nr:hypothetical protein S101447_00625 [Acetobacter ascendens]GCD74260.1 hypothetical protein NBRC3299_0552 [Acetobacter pasteurianus NBRC 3299]